MVVKSVITPACHAGGRGFESRPLRDLTDENRKVLVRYRFRLQVTPMLHGTLLVALLLASAGCATPNDVKYEASYSGVNTSTLERMAIEATEMQGYSIANAQPRLHDFAFITFPQRIDPADAVDVGFLVHLVYEVQSRTKKHFSVAVIPRAFVHDHEVSNDQLPPTARARARELADAIRAHARQYEVPR